MRMGSDPPLLHCSPLSARGVWALQDTSEHFLLSTTWEKPAAAQHLKANAQTSFVGLVMR